MSGTPADTDSLDSSAPTEEALQAVTHERLAKTERLRAQGIEPFPHIP